MNKRILDAYICLFFFSAFLLSVQEYQHQMNSCYSHHSFIPGIFGSVLLGLSLHLLKKAKKQKYLEEFSARKKFVFKTLSAIALVPLTLCVIIETKSFLKPHDNDVCKNGISLTAER